MLPLCVHRGHDFRMAFEKLGGLRALTDAPSMALTASAPANTQSKIIKSLHLKDPIVVSQSLDRANIFLSTSPIRSVKICNCNNFYKNLKPTVWVYQSAAHFRYTP